MSILNYLSAVNHIACFNQTSRKKSTHRGKPQRERDWVPPPPQGRQFSGDHVFERQRSSSSLRKRQKKIPPWPCASQANAAYLAPARAVPRAAPRPCASQASAADLHPPAGPLPPDGSRPNPRISRPAPRALPRPWMSLYLSIQKVLNGPARSTARKWQPGHGPTRGTRAHAGPEHDARYASG